ncbi:protein translocase subunit SecF [Enemella sp. A6]|uniref:protein translocase subunit SecF n=1 Tax=Enemella sp. A6 TaxID=3440152 RepID=UPI003EBAC201
MRETLARLRHGTLDADFVGRRKRWYIVSGIILVICILALLIRGLTLGIEFKGGADFQVSTPVTAETTEQYRQAVLGSGVENLEDLSVLTIGDNTVRVQTRSLEVDEVVQVRQAIADQAGVSAEEVNYNLIGASWGGQITKKGLLALAVFIVLVMILIAVYFRDWKTSVAAIAGVFHDLIVTIGVYALVGFTVTPATLIGVLTILGYSLYDTMVVFDKVRENVKGLTGRRTTYTDETNRALNQVLVRSVNTTVIGLLPVLALLVAGVFVLGTGPLKDLSLAMAVGMAVGAYSSIFVASSLLVEMKEREPAMIEHRRRLAHRAERAAMRKHHGQSSGSVSVLEDTEVVTEEASEPQRTPVSRRDFDEERRQPRRKPRSQRKK